jgi:hypothetical protein
VHFASRPLEGGALTWLTWVLFFVLAASLEELLMRGYGYVWLMRSLDNGLGWGLGRLGLDTPTLAWARWLAITATITLASSAVFGAGHMGNTGATTLSLVNTVLAGVWFAVLVLRTRSLWPAIAMHWAWNISQNLVLGLPVSGAGSEDSPFRFPSPYMTQFEGPEWLTGGAYGIEGSVVCTAVMLLGTVVAALWPRRPPQVAITGLVYLPAAASPETPEGDQPASAL